MPNTERRRSMSYILYYELASSEEQTLIKGCCYAKKRRVDLPSTLFSHILSFPERNRFASYWAKKNFFAATVSAQRVNTYTISSCILYTIKISEISPKFSKHSQTHDKNWINLCCTIFGLPRTIPTLFFTGEKVVLR